MVFIVTAVEWKPLNLYLWKSYLPAKVAAVSKKLPKSVTEWLSKIGTKGGKVTSPAKAAAVRENGKLGGRPRKRKAKR